jgi:xanthine dehydrogenase small subunit
MELPSGSSAFSFSLNGARVEVRGDSVQSTLLDYLRSHGLTGSKEGCAEGECGACTVVVVKPAGAEPAVIEPGTVKPQAQGSAYRAVNSCLLMLPSVAGQEVYTVEALATGDALHPAQQAMAAAGGSQCGYCTPGFVLSLFAEQYRPERIGPCDVNALGGNLCRCTGYRPIRDAALSLGPAPDDRFRRRLSQPAPSLEPMSYRARDGSFFRPGTLADCIALLADRPGACLVAGATDLAVESNLRGRQFGPLVSVEALQELQVFENGPGSVEIGAGLTLSEIAQRWHAAPAVLAEWLDCFASPLIRNRATLGGNLATASPIGDSAPLLLALDAEVKIAGPAGLRTLPLDGFFTGYRRTALQPGELLVSVKIPTPLPGAIRFFKASKRRLDDISTVAACFALRLDRMGRVTSARIAYGGVAGVPMRVKEAEDRLIGQIWNGAALQRAQRSVERALRPMSDHRGSAAYRLALAQSLLEKFHFELGAAA